MTSCLVAASLLLLSLLSSFFNASFIASKGATRSSTTRGDKMDLLNCLISGRLSLTVISISDMVMLGRFQYVILSDVLNGRSIIEEETAREMLVVVGLLAIGRERTVRRLVRLRHLQNRKIIGNRPDNVSLAGCSRDVISRTF